MDFNQIYSDVVANVSKTLAIQNILDLDAYDVVNDSYLILIESDKLVTKESLLSASMKSINHHRHRDRQFKREFSKATSITCKRCNESKPTAMFGIATRKKTGIRTIQPYCRDCASAIYADWYAKNKHTKEYKEKERKRRRERYLKTGK